MTERVVLHVSATNEDTRATRVVFKSSYGLLAFDAVAPGATVSGDIATGQRSVAAGSVTATAYIAADATHGGAYTYRTLSYSASVATVDPRGRTHGNGCVHPQTGHSFLAGYIDHGSRPGRGPHAQQYGDSGRDCGTGRCARST